MLMLAACSAPAEQPYQPSRYEPLLTHNQLLTGDGHSLPVRYWLPSKTKPAALIIAVHGFNDYSNAFEGPGKHFRKHGIATFAYDQRGFGATRSHGIWGGEKNLIGDLKQMVLAVKKRFPDTPIYLLGESMGGAVVIAALAQEDFPPVEGAILSAPAVWGSETMNVFYRSTLWLMAHTMPDQTLTGRNLGILASDNIEMLRAMGRDPLVIKETRIDAIYGIVSLMGSAYVRVKDVKTPLLFLYGANDQVIPKEPVEMAIGNIRAPFKMAYYPEGYHMLLRDLKAEVVLDDIIAWIQNPKDQLPSGYDKEDWRSVAK